MLFFLIMVTTDVLTPYFNNRVTQPDTLSIGTFEDTISAQNKISSAQELDSQSIFDQRKS